MNSDTKPPTYGDIFRDWFDRNEQCITAIMAVLCSLKIIADVSILVHLFVHPIPVWPIPEASAIASMPALFVELIIFPTALAVLLKPDLVPDKYRPEKQ